MPKSTISRFSKYMFPRRVAVKLALILCVLVIILFSLLGLTITQMTRDVLMTNVQRTNMELARRAAHELSLFVNRPLELLGITSNLIGKTRADAWKQETILVEMSLEYPMFEEIISVNVQGETISSSNPGGVKKNYSEYGAFLEALRGRTYVSSIQIGADHLPEVTMAVPYRAAGKISGVLIGEVNLRGIWDITDSIRVGETGRAFLLSAAGYIVAHPNKKLVVQNKNMKSNPAFQKILEGKVGSTEYLADDGLNYLASYAPLEGMLPLIAVIKIQTNEAYKLLDDMRSLIWVILFISILGAIFLSFILAGRLVRPVRALQHWSRKVAIGDFDYQIAPKSSDEIGQLFIMFKRMSERLKLARERERLAALGEAAATVSHKLKNAIVSLKTYAQLFPKRKDDKQFITKFETNFKTTIHYLERMFKNLSQVAASRKSVKEVVTVDKIFSTLESRYSEPINGVRVEVQRRQYPVIPPFLADSEQILELLDNLVQNGIQAIPSEGKVEINARFETNPDRIFFMVQDSGTGIRPYHLEKLFKPFFTTKHGGMGLGLAICKRIVEEHEGTIEVESNEGQGTLFTIVLPLKVPSKKEL